nr:ABC transporter permease subunit [Oscillospiraceae bacterium]
EAAYMDGASDLDIYVKVIMPMIRPAVATASILVFQQVWTNMETSNYFFSDDSMKTLTFYMNTLVNVNNNVAGQGMAAAASLIMFLPNLILFIILQNKVMNTMASSGIK